MSPTSRVVDGDTNAPRPTKMDRLDRTPRGGRLRDIDLHANGKSYRAVIDATQPMSRLVMRAGKCYTATTRSSPRWPRSADDVDVAVGEAGCP